MMQPSAAGIGGFVGDHLQGATVSAHLAAVMCASAVLVLACSGVWLAATDIREHRLPGSVVRPLYPVTATLLGAAALLAQDTARLWWMLWGLVIMGGIFLLLRLLHPAGMGLGDVRLAGVLGLVTGFSSVTHTVLALALTFVLAGVFCLVLVLLRRASASSRIPLGPFMIVGSLGVVAFA
ncbi:prepilin peptidase [Kocuria tytonis]|uniref:Prepilin peptidase n=1 Tax=Kocuria tytonis TaxID=2054280 RepID=A0A495A4I5_9MICC|nr:A24 family peptidase [Kocuria tytonis]RKQ34129.1 prepilin peptidase [Kocuria tytonis]